MESSAVPVAAEGRKVSSVESLLVGLSTKVTIGVRDCLNGATQTQLSTVQSELEEARSELVQSRKVILHKLTVQMMH